MVEILVIFLVLAENAAQESLGTGIFDVAGNEFKVFPNPIVDEINITMRDVDEEIMISLYNA